VSRITLLGKGRGRPGERPLPERTNPMEKIIEMLDRLADLRSSIDLLRLDYEAKKNAILAPVLNDLTALDAEYQPTIDQAQANVAELEAEIKTAVIGHGATVKGGFYQAIYSAGRVSYDPRALDAFAKARPEILDFRRRGEPSVSLRPVK
jgi:hypothetical protein